MPCAKSLRSEPLLAYFTDLAHHIPEERAAIRNEARAVETEIKFAGYLEQQKKSIEKLKAAEAVAIPEWIEYGTISGLSREMRETLERVRPHHHWSGQPHSRRDSGRALACARLHPPAGRQALKRFGGVSPSVLFR